MTLTSKYASDGTSTYNSYNQAFSDSTKSNQCILLFSMVSLALEITGKETGTSTTVWKNQHSGSTRQCRFMKFRYDKETKEN